MKKILFSIIAAVSLLASCQKEQPGMTATVDLAGEWVVTYDVVAGGQNYGDAYGIGEVHLQTYNTQANKATEMWVDDLGNFWEYKLTVACDVKSLTFSTSDFVDNEYYECKVKVSNGKITLDGAKTPSGMPADAIEFDVEFDDDDDAYVYHVHGYRYTGFAADE